MYSELFGMIEKMGNHVNRENLERIEEMLKSIITWNATHMKIIKPVNSPSLIISDSAPSRSFSTA